LGVALDCDERVRRMGLKMRVIFCREVSDNRNSFNRD
jgi:hypothetical protein